MSLTRLPLDLKESKLALDEKVCLDCDERGFEIVSKFGIALIRRKFPGSVMFMFEVLGYGSILGEPEILKSFGFIKPVLKARKLV